MERWDPDAYAAIIFHKGPLTGEAAETATLLEKRLADEKAPINLYMRRVDRAGELDEDSLKLWKSANSPEKPWLVVQFPAHVNVEQAAWSVPLTKENVELLLDSPVRRETASRIMKGDSAVWLFLDSGDKAKDDASFNLLKEESARLAKLIELPEPEEGDPEARKGLKLAFSTLRFSRLDPKETFMVAALNALAEAQKISNKIPMAAPAFGQGRMLTLYGGDDISKDNIADASAFLTGACSCIVKEQNPGIDMLVSARWRDILVNPVVEDKPLPPLSGFEQAKTETAKTEAAVAEKTPVAAEAKTEPAVTSAPPVPPIATGSLLQSMVVFGGVGVLLVAIATIILVNRKEKV